MFNSIAKTKRLLMWNFLFICMSQMPQLALSAGINVMATDVFASQSLSAIQTVISLPNLVSICSGILSAVLISYGIATKKKLAVAGLGLVALTGILAIFVHTQFWQLIMFSIVLGLGIGFFVPSSQSIMIDNFNEKERQCISGLQFSFINLGGIIMSIFGGLLITLVWYGGYLTLLLILPVVVMSIFILPKEKAIRAQRGVAPSKARTKLPTDVFYYAFTLFIFTLMHFVATSNLSTHLSDMHLGNAATTGVASAVMMIGGVVTGLFFEKLTVRLHDYMFGLAFLVLFIGLTMLNVFGGSLFMVIIAVFIIGMSLTLCLPQCLFAASNCLDHTNSAIASTVLSCIAPGLGGFLSPVVFTTITQALGGDSTQFRFQFVGIVALCAAVFYTVNTLRRDKKTAEPEPVN